MIHDLFIVMCSKYMLKALMDTFLLSVTNENKILNYCHTFLSLSRALSVPMLYYVLFTKLYAISKNNLLSYTVYAISSLCRMTFHTLMLSPQSFFVSSGICCLVNSDYNVLSSAAFSGVLTHSSSRCWPGVIW